MRVPEDIQAWLAAKFASVFPHLDERQRRLLMGAEARALGHGGIRLVASAAGGSSGSIIPPGRYQCGRRSSGTNSQ